MYAVHLFHSLANSIPVVAGFVVEGVHDDELPEQMMCCARFSYLDMGAAEPLDIDH